MLTEPSTRDADVRRRLNTPAPSVLAAAGQVALGPPPIGAAVCAVPAIGLAGLQWVVASADSR